MGRYSMFTIFRKRSVKGTDLVLSQLFDERTFYKSFANDLRAAKRSVIIESPYLTKKRAYQFTRLIHKLTKRGVRVRINTRIPRHHEKPMEIQAWKAMKILRASGAKVYICNDMRHRKLAIIDDTILWDGSLNILSQSRSKEIMRRTSSALLCRQMIVFTNLKGWCW